MNRNGFTLIETLVAIALFSIVIAIAVGGFVKALRTQAQILALISANSNASLVIEQIAREVRTGTEFSCLPGSGSCTVLRFVNANGEKVEYKAEDGAILKDTNDQGFKQLTAENVDVQYMLFLLQGEASGDGAPPRVTVSLGITPAEKVGETAVTQIQTTVSARQIDD